MKVRTMLLLLLFGALVTGCAGSPVVPSPEQSPSTAPGASPAASPPPATTAPPVIFPTASPSPSPTPASPPSSVAGDLVDAFVAELAASGATVTRKDTFDGSPLARDAVSVCIESEEIKVYGYPTAAERAATAGQIDPDDPSNIGTSMVSWDGFPKFWGRDRLIVLYLGRDEATSALLTAVLGRPFAQGQGRPPLLPGMC